MPRRRPGPTPLSPEELERRFRVWEELTELGFAMRGAMILRDRSPTLRECIAAGRRAANEERMGPQVG